MASPPASAGADCGAPEPYQPQAAWSGPPADLPPVPPLPERPLKVDGAYTVWGAVHQLRSLLHAADVTSTPIAITGFVVDSSIPRAPACAVHRTGQADPAGCVAEVPSFWLADDRAGAPGVTVRVVGWARNYAVVYDAMAKKGPVEDDILNVTVPFPLPAVGMKVRVTGPYAVSRMVASDMVSEPLGGVMSYQKLEVLEPGPAPAAFGPGTRAPR